MKHRCTRDVVEDLRRGGRLIEVDDPIDPNLEMAEIQRRVYQRGGPAILFKNVIGCRFQMASNLFASPEQARYLFRHTIESVRKLIEIKIDLSVLARNPFRYLATPLTALRMLPRFTHYAPVTKHACSIAELPQLKCWPDDGGAFITLPQVLSSDPLAPQNLMRINLGMYRVQLSGNDYDSGHEVGLHYQIHRGIGVHHRSAIDQNKPLQVAVTVGGSPAMTLAAVMPLPEGLTELTFAGALAGRRIAMLAGDHAPVYADADFAIVGEIDPHQQKPEGPFGDHLGYYSLRHNFPVLKVKHVWHRPGAIWPFTVVGRPPQEDTTFGQLIHELTDPIIPSVLPGVRAVHAVDAAGVHPLLLAIGSERYMPQHASHEPQELLTQANSILGNGQLSLAKYLLIAEDRSGMINIKDVKAFLLHFLARFDARRDLHFQTRTTIDTLDYSGTGLNCGSKVIIAASDRPIRELGLTLPSDLCLADGFSNPKLVLPGVLTVQSPRFSSAGSLADVNRFCNSFNGDREAKAFPLITLVDDSEFATANLSNWLWVTFTRSNPAVDLQGIDSEVTDKHWSCRGPLVIDARIKPHHAPPLSEDPKVQKRVDALASRGGAISRYL